MTVADTADTGHELLLLTTTPDEVALARRFAVTVVAGLGGDDEAQDRVRALVSELVTNVLLHAGTAAVLRIEDDGACVRVTVTDGSAAPARQRRTGRDSTTGRGLRLLETLSAASGSRPCDRVVAGGKTIWFTLHKHADSEEHRSTAEAALALFGVELPGEL